MSAGPAAAYYHIFSFENWTEGLGVWFDLNLVGLTGDYDIDSREISGARLHTEPRVAQQCELVKYIPKSHF